MRKLSVFAFVLPMLFILTACSDPDTAETKVSDNINLTANPTASAVDTNISATAGITAVPTQPAEVTNIEFNKGVWIEKYLDNFACFKFESPDGFQIVSDPKFIDETLQPDVVTESHQHGDHTEVSKLEGQYELITEPGEYETGETTITGYIGKHNKGDKEGTNYIYVINMNDVKIAHFASQGELPSDELLEQIGTVDVLLIQVFANSTYNKLSYEDAAVIIDKLNPKIIIPEHGDSTAGGTLAKLLNVTEDIEDSGSIIISRDILDEMKDTRVVNLDHYK